jgi:tetratricopeptide (TPR) repeat protein
MAGGWIVAESEHFTLHSSAQERATRDYLQQLEAFRWLSLKLLGADEKSVRAQSRFDIYLLEGERALHALRPELAENTVGVYVSCNDGAVAYATEASTLGPDNWDFGRVILLHEYAHHLMFQYGTLVYPSWYVEGFAEYMSTAALQDGAISLGGQNYARVRTLDTPPWLGFDEVLRWGTSAGPAPDRYQVGSLYAQAWLLAHYMLTDDGRARQLADNFTRIGEGEDPVSAFEKATGVKPASLQRTLEAYRRALPTVKVRSAEMPKPAIRITALDEAAAGYALDSSLLRTCPRPERGREILERLRARASKGAAADPQLSLVLARAEMMFGDPAATVRLLQGMVDADDAPSEAHYLFARAWGLQAEKLAGDEQRAAKDLARSHLVKAYRLKKDDAPTLYHLARALAEKGVDQNVLNAARAARLLNPSVPDYALFAAHMELAAGERDRAVRALVPLATNTHAPELAGRMRRVIDAIRSGKSEADVASMMNRTP